MLGVPGRTEPRHSDEILHVAFLHLPSHIPWATSQGSHQVTYLHLCLSPVLLSGNPQLIHIS